MDCHIGKCKDCNCGRTHDRSYQAFPANGNFKPVSRPKRLVRRTPKDAAIRNQERFKETLDILS